MVGILAPLGAPAQVASALKELGALRPGRVCLTLATSAVGFGGDVAFLTGEDPRFVTGVNMPVDGSLSASSGQSKLS